VVRMDAYAALSLDEKLKNANLSQLDKRFCASIVYRTIENLIRIDYALSFFLKDAEALEPTVRDILRISACQLLFHDRIPENAVVDEAVKLTRGAGLEGLTGLTNAVLRSLIRGKEEIKWPAEDEGAKYLSIMYSVPLWLAERLLEAYGPEMAKEICAFRSDAHYTVIRPNLMKYSDEAFEALLQKKVWEVEKGAAPHAFRVRMASEIARDADYLAGNFSIQGESSMLAAQALDVKRGMQVLDCCAAPGGKTAYLAESMAGTGRVYAWDVHEHRVTLIKAMMHRLHLENVRPIVRDAAVLKDELVSTMDAVLLDAPCSGLGVMDNKPDIKYRATKESVKELTDLQEKLLNTCCQYVKKGGALVYSTCSVLPEENAEQIRRFLSSHPDFALSPLPESFEDCFKAQYTDCGLQLLPHRDGVEGFFIARMRRVK
jgi:16S rRNA (cytosine967-C5)-methyltransferase